MSDHVPPDVDFGRVWAEVAGEIWSPPTGAGERGLAWLLGSPAFARVIVTTPSLVVSWLLASVVVLGVGVVVTAQTGEPWIALLAPVLAGVGIAFAYGPGVDPAWELSRSMAISERTVLLSRVVAVFAVNALLGLLASFVVGDALTLTLHWLVPMAMLSALGLAAASASGSAPIGAAAVVLGWALIVLGGSVSLGGMAAVQDARLMPIYSALAVVLASVALALSNRKATGW